MHFVPKHLEITSPVQFIKLTREDTKWREMIAKNLPVIRKEIWDALR